ncbi:dynein heavy chain domain-containing protein 1 [Engraulis encrasicolus]|uniref:dynein heavy chain domain-containing protein 1 n=1 Tax=Engraulis encrasicolus TaxID=184585 RepID=UPI002FD38999
MFSPERDREDKETLTHHAKLPNRTKMDRARLAGPSSPAKAVGPRCETAGLLPPVSRSRPPLTGLLETTTLGLAPLSPPVSMLELPRVLCEVGAEMASSEPVWTEGPFAMSSVLGADIPVKAERPLSKEPAVDSPITAQEWLKQTFASLNTVVEEGVQCKVSDQDMEGKAPKASKAKARPLTGFEVVEILAKQRHLGKMQFYHLHTVEDVQIRPYDLRVVPSNKVGTDYHIFSPYAVVHIQDGISTSVQSLAEWYRDAVTWRSLKDIPLFRNFILHKAFTRWRRNVRRAILQHRSNLLQEQLPLAEPQFRDALLQMSR